ncbi:pentatricopeptide repeat-containing protein At1g43980, mitochondrial [Eucalyptus grandis]|uniref:pentatricopeptide repeat-containing protein At1g43980, mitochondrial n=1 Tax=Eucalyptus grandis TaxID=71139 RepID=UPI00192EA244|nr:pentatricopeptide repeat-containing protein At1g43980, mitochondrial [Eucalyptus grandis]XP_039163915.1 pentatricopeptide repeat-containing protein At1g43980, mitochondrial [Eucalyptus grandis]XP_039163916.1 pentatricopeptide repeat-containing protein At1g43980, mitochondrial [Eucalyptus grandis]XP_039163917.1 pentatricopeptide repeat-containing protein At1g43980, mitochondrial [Eucalyptus grandis]XP_039163918.1 pentatricopeptide repeat-containing protein At1g43980, mitochondrial [Eucalyptus
MIFSFRLNACHPSKRDSLTGLLSPIRYPVQRRSWVWNRDWCCKWAYCGRRDNYGFRSQTRRTSALTVWPQYCMFPLLKQVDRLQRSSLVSYYSDLINQCLSLKSLHYTKAIHAQLIKVGLARHTFLGNRCLDLYACFGTMKDVLNVFDDIPGKNVVSWNICLKGLLKRSDIRKARVMFDGMPQRDVVSWNSMLSWYASNGFVYYALELFWEMQTAGVEPSQYTYSMVASFVQCADHGRQIHARMIRSGMNAHDVVLGNSLIDMYGKLGLVDYAYRVFMTMEKIDIISWNSLISGLCNSWQSQSALELFTTMLHVGQSPDEFTVSLIFTICCNLQQLEKGEQLFCLSTKMGFLSNAIVASAIIDLFSQCNRLEYSVQFFDKVEKWDIALCNSMISSYIYHDHREVALNLFVLVLRKGLEPTEFTLSSVLGAVSFHQAEQGNQLHSLVIKTGLESDVVLASSLLDMYNRVGLVNSSMKVFLHMVAKDLISWNCMIMGLTRNGKVIEALGLFAKLLQVGLPPDRITLYAVLQACDYGGFFAEGMATFSCMEEEYAIIPAGEHYTCVLNLLSQYGKLQEIVNVVEKMPYEPNYEMWELMLRLCSLLGDLELMEEVVRRMMEVEPQSSVPYLVLAREYEMRGRWEGIVRVRMAMKDGGVRKTVGCSWIGINNHVFTFREDQLQYHGGEDNYVVLSLLMWVMERQDPWQDSHPGNEDHVGA